MHGATVGWGGGSLQILITAKIIPKFLLVQPGERRRTTVCKALIQMVQCLRFKHKTQKGGNWGGGGGARRTSSHVSALIQFFCVITSAMQRGTVRGRPHINEAEDDLGRGTLDNHEKICQDTRSSGEIIIKELRNMMKC
jgi:hypothetical protein